MQESSRYYYTANVPAILRTHPLDEDRIAEAENRIPRSANKQYPDNLDYRLFKELIRTSVAKDNRQLLDYYQKECTRNNSPVACQYGHVLVLINLNQYQQAETRLQPLLAADKDNLFYQIAMARAETGNKQYQEALKRLQELQGNYPDNYAAMMAHAQGLIAAGDANKATAILLKGSRMFKRDLPLCEELAQAQSASGKKAYAYFTESQCQLLQGRRRDALRKLQLVKSMAANDKYLLARTNAMIDDIQFMLSD